MSTRLISAVLCIFFIQGLAVADDKKDYISVSIGQFDINDTKDSVEYRVCLLYTSPSPRDRG